MITSVIGKPTLIAPPIINAIAESKFNPARNSRTDMPWLHLAPTGISKKPNDDQKDKSLSGQDR